MSAATNTHIEQAQRRLPPSVLTLIDQARKSPRARSYLIKILHQVQQEEGYLAPPALDAVATLLGVPSAEVSGVASFYHLFRLSPPGRWPISVCMGTACYVKGADKVAERFRDDLGIDIGQSTRNGRFSLHEAACLGTCGLAPVVMIGHDIHAQVTPDQVPHLIERFAALPDES